MKNKLLCHSCQTINPLYAYTCISCNAFLRARIPNIDFWTTISKIIESPVSAAESIIQSDHKNFLSFILFIVSLKISLNLWVINNAFVLHESITNNFFISLFAGIVGFVLALMLISLLFTKTANFFHVQTRFRDNLAIYAYAFLPLAITFAILTPVQIALFGTYWFTFNPSPLIIKELPSYVIFIMEGLFFLWSIILLIVFNYAQLRSILLSIIIGITELILIGIVTVLGFFLFYF